MDIIKDLDQFTLIAIISIAVLFLWNLILSIKLFLTTKRIKKFTRGGKITDLENVIKKYVNEAKNMSNNIENNNNLIKTILDKTSNLKGNVEIIRYNAFGEEGQDLSYSIAFLDEKKNGVVITSIYNRGESSTYAKPIIEGNSKYKLSREELMVLEKVTKSI